jgi:hypothetical protein
MHSRLAKALDLSAWDCRPCLIHCLELRHCPPLAAIPRFGFAGSGHDVRRLHAGEHEVL